MFFGRRNDDPAIELEILIRMIILKNWLSRSKNHKVLFRSECKAVRVFVFFSLLRCMFKV